jgi:hypothetical protein
VSKSWVDVARISAAAAKDVAERVYVSDMTSAQKSQHSAKAAARGRANAKAGKTAGGVREVEFDRLRLAS